MPRPAGEDPYGDDGYTADEEQAGDDAVYTYDPADNAGGDFETLPPLVYLCAIESMERETAKTGTEMWKLTMIVTEPEEFTGRRIWHRTTFGVKYDWTRKGFFAALGYDVSQPFSWTPKVLQGLQVGVLLGHRKGDRRTFEECKEFYPVNDSRVPGHEKYAEAE
jgi:hypothetical protein